VYPLNRLNIRSQLVVVFLILVTPIFLLNWFAGEQTEEILKNQVTDAYVELIKQNHAIIDRNIDTVNKIMTTIILNPLTQSFARNQASEAEVNRVQQYQSMHELLASSSMGVDGGEMIRYSFFVPDDEKQYSFAPSYRSRNSSYVFFFSEEDKPEWYDAAVELKGKGELKIIEGSGPEPVKTVAFIRAVNYLAEGNQVIGVLVATNMDRKIGESVKSIALPAGSSIMVTDMENRLYFGTDGDAVIDTRMELPDDEAFTHTASDASYVINEDNIYVLHENVLMEHKLIYRIPTLSLTDQQNKLKSSIQLLSGVCFALFFLVMLYFLRSLITPLLKLVSFFKVYEPGKSLPELRERERRDEVGSLIASIHDMADRFNQLVHDKYIMEIRNKEAQLQLLYQQINPHLLYNTLESVYWKCILQGENEAADMIKDLSKLMRISLSRGRELISLSEELEHARAYVSLQQKRFEYGFKVEWQIASEVEANVIPKVTLQPIIENAIIHGVRYMEEDGEILISAFQENGRVCIQIEDNGYKDVNIEAIQRSLDEEDNSSNSGGYGARNVHKRIQLHFGSEYGLVYERREPQGLRVKMFLPVRTSRHDQD